MEFRVLGPLEVLDGDRPIQLGGPLDRRLLAVLLANRGLSVSDDALVDALWGEDAPAKPRAALQTAVFRLRKALQVDSDPARSVVQRRDGAYALAIDVSRVDASVFDQLVERASNAEDPHATVETLDQALGLWRGQPFGEAGYEEFAQPETRRLQELRIAACELRVAAQLELGRNARAIAELEPLVEAHPLREGLWSQLMLALYRSGRAAEALRVGQRARRAIGDISGLDAGPQLARLEEAILAQDSALDQSPGNHWASEERTAPRTNLPTYGSSFVGREEDVTSIERMLQESRMVTLVGPGGVGKTRLAIEAARSAIAPSSPGDVFLVRLSHVQDDDHVFREVAQCIRRSDETVEGYDDLIRILNGRVSHLVLDNCEHLVPACARFLARVLAGAPMLRVIATSRRRLGIAAEKLWQVEPLSVEIDESAGLSGQESAAVNLLFDRVRAVRTDVSAADAATGEAAREIVRYVGGLPLAIELAASQAYALSLPSIADQLGSSLGILHTHDPLAEDRHSSLAAAVEWSLDRLDLDERAVFAGVSVIASTWGADGAEAICGPMISGTRPVLDIVTSLVEQSLVARAESRSRSPRFHLLVPLRSVGLRILDELGELEAARRRYARWLARLSVESYEKLSGPEQGAIIRRLRREGWNLAAAFEWALENDPETALEMAAGPRNHLERLGFGSRPLDALRVALEATSERNETRAHGLLAMAWETMLATRRDVAVWSNTSFLGLVGRSDTGPDFSRVGSVDTATAWARKAAAIYGEIGARGNQAFAEAMAAFLETTTDLEHVDKRLGALLGDVAAGGDGWQVSAVKWSIAMVRLAQHQVEAAAIAAHAALDWSTQVGDAFGQMDVLDLLARIARASGDSDSAANFYSRALDLAIREQTLPPLIVRIRIELARQLTLLGQFDAAAQHLGEALAMARNRGLSRSVAMVRVAAAGLFMSQGDLATATGYLDEATSIAVEVGDQSIQARALVVRGMVEFAAGDHAASAERYKLSLRLSEARDDPVADAVAIEGLAVLANQAGDHNRFAVLIGAADAGRFAAMNPRSLSEPVEQATGDAQAALGESQYAKAYADGYALPPAAAVAVALDQP